MPKIGEKVVVWECRTDVPGGQDQWFDSIGVYAGEVEVGVLPQLSKSGELVKDTVPSWTLAGGYTLQADKSMVTILFTEEELRDLYFTSTDNLLYRFDKFIEEDNSTSSKKDYLYQFTEVETDKKVVISPWLALTHQYLSFQAFFGLRKFFESDHSSGKSSFSLRRSNI